MRHSVGLGVATARQSIGEPRSLGTILQAVLVGLSLVFSGCEILEVVCRRRRIENSESKMAQMLVLSPRITQFIDTHNPI